MKDETSLMKTVNQTTGRLYETLYMPRSEKRTPYIRRWPSMLCAALDNSKRQGHRVTTAMLRRGWPLPPGVVLVAECVCTCESTQPDLVPFGEPPSWVVSGWPLRRYCLLAASNHTDEITTWTPFSQYWSYRPSLMPVGVGGGS